MLTDNKEITSPSYWDKVYSGKNDNAPVDASNTKRTSTFDRFAIVVNHVEGPRVLDIGSGHARIPQRIKHANPDWYIIASDQAPEARNVTPYRPYDIFSGYEIPYPEKTFDTVIATQCVEYFEFPEKLMAEAKRVGKCFVCTLPVGLMEKWSQYHVWTHETAAEFFEQFGTIEVFEPYEGIMLFKIRFNG